MQGCVRVGRIGLDRAGFGRLSGLLASSSVAALLIGGGTPAAFAQCAISPGTNQPSVSNSAAINCININGITVTGNVTNTATGTLTATGGNRPTRTGITIVNNASVVGAVINAGHITTPMSGTGIFLKNNPSVSGGITNSGTMSVGNGIVLTTVAQFGKASAGGGIVNSGTIIAASAGISIGLSSHLAQTFYGGISNSGTIAAGGSGFNINTVSMFSGGISNSGILSAASGGAINLANISTFSGGIGNSGTISARNTAILANITNFTGGIANSGTISSTDSNGILLGGNASTGGTGQSVSFTVSTFSGGISNSGMISAAGNGIWAGGNASVHSLTSRSTATVTISAFSGGISNSGTISAGGTGIWTGGNAGANVGFNCCGSNNNIAAVTISSFAGGISNSGTIAAGMGNGIFVGGNASVFNSFSFLNAASVTISNFSGGIGNYGTISAGGNGVWVGGNAEIDNVDAGNTASVTISAFSGGISNSGTISAAGNGIWVGGSVSLPSSASAASGVTNVAAVTISTFSGGISNSGTISADGAGIWVGGNASINAGGLSRNTASVTISTFSGGISNSGTISAGGVGILVGGSASGTIPQLTNFASFTFSIFSGGISNAGKIVAQTGIVVDNVSTFLGAIVNSGTITGSGGTAIDVSGANNAITIDQTGGLISGAIKLSANADQLNISGGAIAGNIIGAGSSDTINFNLGSGNTFTYANTITGVNNLNFNSGTVVLDGTIANGGGTAALTIAPGGTLLIGSNTASIAPDITNNGAFGFAQSGAFSFGNVISGTGLVEQLGPGTTTLTATNLYSGGTVIDGGTLAVGADHNLGAASGGLIFGGGTLQFLAAFTTARTITLNVGGGTFDTNGNTDTLSGAIGGSGNLTVVNSGSGGSLTLTNSGNSYTGATTINSGATLALSGAGTIASSSRLADNGTLDISGLSSGTSIVSLSGGGAVALGANTLTLLNASGTFSGAIAGTGGLTLTTGTETLTGTSPYSGATTINGGTLEVDGSIANSSRVTVNSAGTLSGVGTVDPATTTIMGGGKLAPGNSANPTGALMITGNLAFQSGALYVIHLNSTTSGFASVTGTATLAGTVQANFASGSYVPKQYTILESSGLGGTTFAGLTSAPSNFDASLSYSADDVFLNLTAALGAGTPLNQNQRNVANAINTTFNSGGTLPSGFANLFNLTGANLSNALTHIDGEAATGTQQATFDAMSQFMGVMTDPFMNRGGGGVNTGSTTPGYAEEGYGVSAYAPKDVPRSQSERDAYAAIYHKAPPIADSFTQRWSVWAAGYGGSQTTDGNAALGSNTATSSIAGTAVGADYRISPYTLAGFALAGGGTSFNVAGSGSGHSDLFQAGAFIRHTVGPAYISGALAYGWQDITTNRTVTVAGLDQLRAEFNANAWSGRLEGGYRFVSPATFGIGITPYAAAQFVTFDLPSYAEQAIVGTNNFALAYNAKSVTDTRSELGIRTDKSWAMTDGILTLRGRVAWARDYDPDRSIAATFQALPGASFVVNGAAQASDSVLTTASVEKKWRNGWSAAATFEGEFSNVTASYAGKGVVRYQW
jgi:autotransporter-associated beta strand protein